ncbi:MAG TPA: SBBP repeat-containing protein, partial [Bacteroidia bacterium]|nr:SBBP repeat-containing protein [Bacteroidia bacterium]
MRKYLLLISLFAFSFSISFAQSPNWVWAKTAAGNINTYGMTSDANGNSYVTGFFSGGSITLGSFTLTNTGSWDMFVAKYDPSGNVLWAKSAGGNNNVVGEGVATDNAGNVYVVGCFESSSLTFGSTTLTDAGSSYNIFLVKYDANGNVAWAKSAGDGSNTDNGIGVATDNDGNIFITGYFQNSTITFGTFTLTNTAYQNAFIVKYNGAGNVLWAKAPTASGGTGSNGNRISTDVKGNAYITGSNNGSALTFGIYTLNSIGSADAFAVKYDSTGNVHWAKSFGSASGGGE